jgi:RNA-splicing ligase RtcB
MREDDPETARLLTSISGGMNYGYAYRMAMASRIMYGAKEVLGASTPVTLVYDASHNSIQQETVRSRRLWVHRHNSCKIESGRPLLVPGHHYAQSYLAIGGENAEQFLNSAPHGLGELASGDRRHGAASLADHSTLRFDNWEKEPTAVPHIRSASVERAFSEMENLQLLRRTVELRPMAVLKNFRG